MERTLITPDLTSLPETVQKLVSGGTIYDSSCSPEARVWFIDKDDGFYLKTASAGSLKTEAEMTDFFYRKHLSAEVLAYESGGRDYLITRAIPGEDCIHPRHLDDPKRLSETMGILLRRLHETDCSGCPVTNRTQQYLDAAQRNHRAGHFDLSLFNGIPPFSSAEETWQIAQRHAGQLKQDTLLHGDYCLPNILLKDWNLAGFIDVGNGGVGDRHIDLFWGAWTLIFNLKTDIWCGRFLDAYGRDKAETDLLWTVAALETFT